MKIKNIKNTWGRTSAYLWFNWRLFLFVLFCSRSW